MRTRGPFKPRVRPAYCGGWGLRILATLNPGQPEGQLSTVWGGVGWGRGGPSYWVSASFGDSESDDNLDNP